MNTQKPLSVDRETADAFTTSWNNLPQGSVYTFEQFEEWFLPLSKNHIINKKVLELGCGGGSLMTHLLSWEPEKLTGVDLGLSIDMAERNCSQYPIEKWEVIRDDLVSYRGDGYDLVYCIGVLHHLKNPEAGLLSMIENTKPGGRFHGWVYAYEGNWLIRNIVDPIRKLASKLPWWFTKYLLATPLMVPFYLYAKFFYLIGFPKMFSFLPLYEYAKWISVRPFSFFRHVAFDQLVTPQTTYITKKRIEQWLANDQIDQSSTYIIFRNGNSWKFGGCKKT